MAPPFHRATQIPPSSPPPSAPVPAPGGRRDRADMPVDRDCLNAFQSAIGAQRSPVHLAPQDVDPQQLLTFLVPARALAQQPRGYRPRFYIGGTHAVRSTTTLM